MPRTEDEMSGEYSLDDRKITDGRSPSKMSKEPPVKASGKSIVCKVYLLDGQCVDIGIDKNDNGRALFDKVCSHVNLVEREYFGLTYVDDRGSSHYKVWLNLDKKVAKQKKRGDLVFEFAIKFYPPDPSQLREDLTRWLVVMQVRRDLVSGRIPCTFSTYALLGSYNVQADVQDYDPAVHGSSFEYIRDMVFAPNQTPELMERIAELHRQHKGQEPYEADKNFLDNAKRLAMYGVDLHKAKDSDNVIVMVGVCCSGLLIYREKLRLNRFVWPKILKLSYKRNHFYIKIRPGEMEKYETTMMFKLETHKLAKRLWKTCVEHHAFFRLREAEKPDSSLTFPRFGSKLRYSDNTLSKKPKPINRPPPYFDQKHAGKGNQAHSVDNLTHGTDDDSMYDSDGYGKKYPTSHKDGKDWSKYKGVPTAIAKVGKDADSWSSGDENTWKKTPQHTEYTESKVKPPAEGNVTLEHEKGQGYDDYMGVSAGGITETPEEARDRRKKEKEADKKRKEEAEKKKKSKELSASEDKLDKVGSAGATQTVFGVGPGSSAVESGKDETFHLYGPPYDRDGYNKYGYDRDGYDRDGYDKDGYDRDDYDIKGRKKPYAAPFERDGYNVNGYGKDGYDRDGYDKNAFDRDGYSKKGRRNPYGPPYDKYGFNENGFNKHGLDPDGYDKDGYDRNDLDRYGRKNPYAPPYDRDGYNENGFDKHGFDREGFDKDGFDKDGYDRYGRKTPYGPPYDKDGYNKNGYDKDGYDRDGYDKDGYDKDDYDIKGRKKPYAAPFGRDGYNVNGYGKDGHDRDGYDKNAFDRDGYSKKGRRNPYGPPYDKYGFNENGFNKHGLDPDGYDKDGYDRNDLDRYGRKNPYAPPYDRDGYNENGFDKHGFDREGFDKDGFDKDGYDRYGRKTPYGPPYDKDGYNKNGYDREGFDREGYDKDGYDRDGFDRDGYDKDGYDRDDYDIKGRKKPYAAPFGKDGYNVNGYGKDGYDRDGYDKNAFDRDGYSKKGRRNPYGPPYDKYGFNENGFNKHGLDPDGYDKDGYDRNDLDRRGRKNPYAPPYDRDGYNENGFDKHGFDREGFDKDGFDKDGYDRYGRKTPYGPPYDKDGYNKNGYDREGFDREGYDKDGYDRDGFDRDGYDKDGYDRDDYDIKGRKKPYAAPFGRDGYNVSGYGKDGYDRDGYDKNAFDRDGYSKKGRRNPYGLPYDKYGFNENGFNKHGLDPDGYDKDGYDRNDLDKYGRKNPYAPPYDRDGYNENGFDKHSFDREGFDKDGFDKDGYDRNGRKTPYGPPYDKDGFNKYGFNKDGYDRNGYDKDGFDWEGYDEDGYNRHGVDKDGKPRRDGPLSQLKTEDGYRDIREKGSLLGAVSGLPYGMDLVMGKVDMTGVVGKEGTVDNKVEFLPVTKPVRETKSQLKPEYSDNALSFNPDYTSTISKSKVPPPVPPKGKPSVSGRNVPMVKTEKHSVTYERGNSPYDLDEGTLVSAHTHSSRLQTIETTTYKTEKDGVVETTVEQRITISLGEDEDIDYDTALANAIRSVVEFNPDMSVERIECVQHIEDNRSGN